MSQVAFLVILLLAFGERKGVATFRARYLDIWHVADLPGEGLRYLALLALRTQRTNPLLLANTIKQLERAGAQTNRRRSPRPNNCVGRSVLHRQAGFKGNLVGTAKALVISHLSFVIRIRRLHAQPENHSNCSCISWIAISYDQQIDRRITTKRQNTMTNDKCEMTDDKLLYPATQPLTS